MNTKTALKVFTSLECDQTTHGTATGSWTEPTYDVRLDASSSDDGDRRSCRVRVTPFEGSLTQDQWRYVLDLAGEHDLSVVVQNGGMELR